MPHDRYGMDVANPYIHHIQTPAGPLCEFPPSVLRYGPLKLGIAGGRYFRFYPFAWTAARLRRLLQASGEPLVFYMYPFEVDPQQPRTKAGSRLSRFRHYVNLRHTAGRLERRPPPGRPADFQRRARPFCPLRDF